MKLSSQISFSKKISHLDRLLFTKHLATMIKAGIPIAESLETLKDQSKSSSLKIILTKVLSDVENGQALAKALSNHPKAFDQFYISLVKVGEESGSLEKNLDFLSKQLSKDYTLRKKIQGAMLYPLTVFLAAVIMGGFISLAVLPKLVSFFDAFEIDLPTSTKVLLFIANFMKNYGVIFFIGLFAFFVLLSFFLNSKLIKPWWHKTLLKIPLFGNLIASGQLARFTRNFGTLIQSGVPITRALDTTAATLSNLKFRNNIKSLSDNLSKGKKIGQALQETGFEAFPPLVSKMISVGEKTGKLEDTLLYLSEFFEDEIDNSSKNLTTILEPILLIVIGLIVAFVALAIISPIYELTGSIRR
jgi:type II secretory pathway component PulF